MASYSARRSLSSYLVTPAELQAALKKNPPTKISTAPRTVALCATWFLPNDGRNGLDTFREKRIPSSRFFDLDKVIDKHSPYPHMLPSASDFAKAMSGLGIRRDDTVVVYDSQELGIFSAPRVGWTLKAFGHDSVHVLNNFKLWVEEGYPTESGEFWDVDTCVYKIPEFDASMVVDFEEVKEITKDHNKEGAEGVQILDARSHGRWSGKDPEPREGLSSGHMPGSISVSVSDLLDPVKKTILPADQLRKIFESKGVDPKRPTISSCGTGVTAAVIDAALSEAGYGDEGNRRVYDGSWTEWAQRVKPSDGLIIKEE
ncbi:putative 3-mercaptopyruvate sulfurtransferase [Lachnellula suecica]|uniref:Putative 3-mercaptopyruvate sulfurtransferase n=1 Tax=Lachnellula suecica TaxID=602035 RepID=A0A8T9C5I0_9HELO|nr:putative 3-mercaptopyruvate sulfurtransferase [Lachnellula suecica]